MKTLERDTTNVETLRFRSEVQESMKTLERDTRYPIISCSIVCMYP